MIPAQTFYRAPGKHHMGFVDLSKLSGFFDDARDVDEVEASRVEHDRGLWSSTQVARNWKIDRQDRRAHRESRLDRRRRIRGLLALQIVNTYMSLSCLRTVEIDSNHASMSITLGFRRIRGVQAATSVASEVDNKGGATQIWGCCTHDATMNDDNRRGR